MLRYVIHITLFLIPFFISSVLSFAEAARMALIIGNSSYKESPLPNPINDAQDMASTLEKLGFDVTYEVDMKNKAIMKETIRQYSKKLINGSISLFYFSGHGLQFENKNFLLPIESKIRSEADIESEGMEADYVIDHMRQVNNDGINIIILDACRENPYQSTIKGLKTGLAEMKKAKGTLIAYATAPGRIAYGDISHRNSVYTKHLLQAFQLVKHLSITDFFVEVAGKVFQETNGSQEPWQAVFLTKRVFFEDYFKFPKKILYIIKRNGQILGQCEYEYIKEGEYKNASLLILDSFDGLGFSKENKIYTHVIKDIFTMYRTILLKGNDIVYELRIGKGTRFDGTQGDIFYYKDNKNPMIIQTSEIYSVCPVVDFLSIFLYTSKKVAEKAYKEPEKISFFTNHTTKLVKLVYRDNNSISYNGHNFQVSTIAGVYDYDYDYNVIFNFSIHKNDDYYYPIKVVFADGKDGVLELQADKIIK